MLNCLYHVFYNKQMHVLKSINKNLNHLSDLKKKITEDNVPGFEQDVQVNRDKN